MLSTADDANPMHCSSIMIHYLLSSALHSLCHDRGTRYSLLHSAQRHVWTGPPLVFQPVQLASVMIEAALDLWIYMQPTLAELTTDEKGPFALYGPTAFLVAYDTGNCSFYEVCEAVWLHWMQLQQEHPGLDADSIFYWIDIFAMSPDELSRPLCAFGDQLQQVLPDLWNQCEGLHCRRRLACLGPGSDTHACCLQGDGHAWQNQPVYANVHT